MMFIKDGKRINIHAPYTDENGNRYINLESASVRESLGISEIPDPIPPADDLTFYVYQESEDSPYATWTRKTDAEILAIRWERLKQIRDNIMLNGGCFHEGKWFHSDAYSKLQQLALYNLGAAIPAGLQWKTMDGSFVTMTQTLAASLYMAQITRDNTVFQIAETKKLDQSDIYAGWPDVFVEE